MNDQVLLPRSNLERVPPWACPGLEGDEVLMSQLQKEVLQGLDGVLRFTRDAHVAAGPPGEIGKRGNRRCRTVGLDDGKLAAWMVRRVDDGEQIDRNVD